jgi:hypothetical protein
VLWIVNLTFGLVTNFYLVFLHLIWVGVMGGTVYTNFFYLANTRTKLKSDFKLHYTERELTVNMLMISNDLGLFFAGISSFIVQAWFFPLVLISPPS